MSANESGITRELVELLRDLLSGLGAVSKSIAAVCAELAEHRATIAAHSATIAALVAGQARVEAGIVRVETDRERMVGPMLEVSDGKRAEWQRKVAEADERGYERGLREGRAAGRAELLPSVEASAAKWIRTTAGMTTVGLLIGLLALAAGSQLLPYIAPELLPGILVPHD